jgi:hypothetical protein
MKKIIFLIIIVICSWIQLSAQSSYEAADLVGQWTTEETTTEIVFWMDKHGSFQMVSWNKTNGDILEVENLKVYGTTLTVKTTYKPTNWAIQRTFTIVDENKLKETITGDTETILYWKRVK